MSFPVHSQWRLDRPAEGFYSTELTCHPSRHLRTFLPDGYEPRYAYPLLVMFHGHGSNEEQVLRLAPRMSRKNFIAVSMRGPELLGLRSDGKPACGWGETPDIDLNEYLVESIKQTRRIYHIHSERVYLVGINEGAEAAYKLGFSLGDKIAGVVSLNGAMPKPQPGKPLFRLNAIRDLPVLIGHGIANSVLPYSMAMRDRNLLYTAGANVKIHSYASTHKIHPDMLRDLNRWVMGHVNSPSRTPVIVS